MNEVFADSFYWVALYNKRDEYHGQTLSASKGLGSARIVTTDEVLIESANLFFQRTSLHNETIVMIRTILKNPNVTAVAQTRKSFLDGLEFLEARPDKDYSLTDCISMNAMKRRGISEVLTHDRHFKQEGFKFLL
ncbi:MAG: type II toxin-antitoxin system VapC family toxin [candidate division Zixibacteria bacterium]|nr:type II toxin-antitoxin system VapC family toxin [candidate division Zixibacteria bacterium]